MMTYLELKATPGQFLAIAGVPAAEFDKYLPQFVIAYNELYPSENASGKRWQQPLSGSAPDILAQIEDKLLFIWLSCKGQVTPPMLEAHFGLNETQVSFWIEHLLPVMQLALRNLTTTKLQPNCVKFLQLLDTFQVEYLVIGGHAVAFFGYLRPILDLDIFISTDPQNAEKMEQVLCAFGPGVPPQAAGYFQLQEKVIRIGKPPFEVEQSVSVGRFIQFGLPPIQIEVMTSISAVTFEECYPQRVSGFIDEAPVQFIGLAQLKVNKAASIREKDADDFSHLNGSMG